MEWIDIRDRLPEVNDHSSTDSVGDVLIRYWVGPGEKHVEISTMDPIELHKKYFWGRQIEWLEGWNTTQPARPSKPEYEQEE